jgi:hypothetical protein
LNAESTWVHLWWTSLSLIALINLGALVWVVSRVRRLAPGLAEDERKMRRDLLLLSTVYTLGCAFRSVLPRADVQRICLYDTPLSSVLVGRSVATIAELCFAAEWARWLGELGQGAGVRPARLLSRSILPLIVFAETCSWSAVITTDYLGNVFEESSWMIAGGLMTVGLLSVRPQASEAARRWVSGAALGSAVYAVYLAAVDVPMYFHRWQEDEAAGRVYLGFADGLSDLAHRWAVTWRFEDWHQEMIWMSLYFSFGVWLSLALVFAPRISREAS